MELLLFYSQGRALKHYTGKLMRCLATQVREKEGERERELPYKKFPLHTNFKSFTYPFAFGSIPNKFS